MTKNSLVLPSIKFKRGSGFLGAFMVVGSLMVLSGCGQAFQGDRSPPSLVDAYDYSTALEGVSEDGCLRLDRLFSALRALPPQTHMRTHTSEFNIHSRSGMRDNFKLMLAIGAFSFEDGGLTRFLDGYPSVRQEGCTKVTFDNADAESDDFKVIKSAERSLTLEHSDGRVLEWSVTGPQSLEVGFSYDVTDFRCGRGMTTARVTYRRAVHWGGSDVWAPGSAPVSRGYLRLLARSTNQVSFDSAWMNGPSAESVEIPVEDLEAMSVARPRSEILQCMPSGGASRPEPEPEPDPANPPPSSEESPARTHDPA